MVKSFFPALLSIALIYVNVTACVAHTSRVDTVICPIDGTRFPISVTSSMTVFGNYLDFEKKGAIGDYYETLINSCPRCHYSGFKEDFDSASFTPLEKKDILNLLRRAVSVDDAIECEITASLYEYRHKSNDTIALCFLIGSYLLRTEPSRIELRKTYQDSAAIYFTKAVHANEYPDSVEGNVWYLIGEMYRRSSQFDQATESYKKAISSKGMEEEMLKLCKEQELLAEKKDDNNLI